MTKFKNLLNRSNLKDIDFSGKQMEEITHKKV